MANGRSCNRLNSRPGAVGADAGEREAALRQQAIDAIFEHAHFNRREQGGHGAGVGVVGIVEARAEQAQVCENRFGDGLAGEIPDHGAQLFAGVEGQAVVDAPELPVFINETVAAFAVGIVGDGVEDGHALQLRQQLRIIEGVVMFFGIVVDEKLHRAEAAGASAQERGRHEVPAEGFGCEVGGGFAVAERAIGEIPKRSLAAARFVDGEQADAVADDVDKEGVIRAPAHQADFFVHFAMFNYGDGFIQRDADRFIEGAGGVDAVDGHGGSPGMSLDQFIVTSGARPAQKGAWPLKRPDSRCGIPARARERS